ncbi:MAG: hypothetical protein JXQ73_19510 [Phycisphaerae bacterium]|nr:hypothetical protein [Phycisphaerae bacterium]
MSRLLDLILVLAVVAWPVCLAAQDGKAAGSSQTAEAMNVYQIDPIDPDVVDRWKPIGRTRVQFLVWNAFEPGTGMLDLRIEPSKAGQMVHGVQRRRLGLPLPRALRFRVWTDATYLWVVLGDKKGARATSRIPVEDLKPCQWCDIELPLDKTKPMGVGSARIHDLDLIAFLTRESAGEIDESPVRLIFSKLEVVYPKGVGPTNPTFTKQDLDQTIAPLGKMLRQIDALLAEASNKGLDVRYPTVSRTVLDRFSREILAIYRAKEPLRTKTKAEFLLDCAKRTQRELEDMIKNPAQAVRVPEIPLKNLRCRQGSYFAGDRPVFLAGVCGWFGPQYFPQLSATGYSVLAIEVGPRSMLPEEGKVDPAGARGIHGVLDSAAQHNMVCDLLVSPHYFPDWARKKWPGTDATGWRRQTNNFMPWTITDPHFRRVIAAHLEALIPQIREHPALLSYDLINEAWYRLIPDFPARQWMEYRKRHADTDEWQALSQMVTENVTEFLKWYIDQLHRHDKAHPVHIKTIDTPDVLSVDREAVGEVLTANGMDAMPSWPDWTGRLAADFAWPFLRHDFHRSLQPDQPIMDGEYHISGGTWPMPSSYFRAALWGLALHGRDSTACWVYDRVDDVSLYWHPNGVEELGRAALDFIRLGPEIHAFQRQRSALAMYYGGTQTSDAYRACLFQDLDVGIATEKRIRDGCLEDYKVLVIPFGSRLSENTRGRLDALRKNGGQVVRCPAGVPIQQVWDAVRRAMDRAQLQPLVRTGQWGIECRSVTLGRRRLFYLLNHRRKVTRVNCQSDWTLEDALDLRTAKMLDARKLEMRPMEFRLIEVR